MRSDVEGSAAASAAPVSRFAGTLMEILDRVEYSRVRMDVTDNPIYRLRYEAYRREESVPFNDAGIVVDDLTARFVLTTPDSALLESLSQPWTAIQSPAGIARGMEENCEAPISLWNTIVVISVVP